MVCLNRTPKNQGTGTSKDKPVVICLNLRKTFAASTSTPVFYPKEPSETKWNDEYRQNRVTNVTSKVMLYTINDNGNDGNHHWWNEPSTSSSL